MEKKQIKKEKKLPLLNLVADTEITRQVNTERAKSL